MIFGDLKMRHTKWGADATSCGLSFPGNEYQNLMPMILPLQFCVLFKYSLL
jgi:hypothetical protein